MGTRNIEKGLVLVENQINPSQIIVKRLYVKLLQSTLDVTWAKQLFY